MNEDGFESVGRVGEFEDGVIASLSLDSGDGVCVVRVGEEVYCINEECPHGEFSMSEGAMVDDYVIECGGHCSQFDVRDGSVIEAPAEEPIEVLDVCIVDDLVWVRRRETRQAYPDYLSS